MTNKEIVAKLHEYYEARNKYRALRTELVELAVEHGQLQQDAIKAAAEYLDGYLAGAGLLPTIRVVGGQKSC